MKLASLISFFLLLSACGQKEDQKSLSAGGPDDLALAAAPVDEGVRTKRIGHIVAVELPDRMADGNPWPETHYDTEYVNAQKVLGEGLKPAITKGAARTLDALMRSIAGRPRIHPHSRSSLLSALLASIPSIAAKDAKFTYVIRQVEGRTIMFIRHSQVGRLPFKLEDALSKHLRLNKFQEKVNLAGEITVSPTGELLFDYDSGTFKPDEKSLGSLQATLRATLVQDRVRTQTINEKKGKPAQAAPAEPRSFPMMTEGEALQMHSLIEADARRHFLRWRQAEATPVLGAAAAAASAEPMSGDRALYWPSAQRRYVVPSRPGGF